jgi:hypothetical protein
VFLFLKQRSFSFLALWPQLRFTTELQNEQIVMSNQSADRIQIIFEWTFFTHYKGTKMYNKEPKVACSFFKKQQSFSFLALLPQPSFTAEFHKHQANFLGTSCMKGSLYSVDSLPNWRQPMVTKLLQEHS